MRFIAVLLVFATSFSALAEWEVNTVVLGPLSDSTTKKPKDSHVVEIEEGYVCEILDVHYQSLSGSGGVTLALGSDESNTSAPIATAKHSLTYKTIAGPSVLMLLLPDSKGGIVMNYRLRPNEEGLKTIILGDAWDDGSLSPPKKTKIIVEEGHVLKLIDVYGYSLRPEDVPVMGVRSPDSDRMVAIWAGNSLQPPSITQIAGPAAIAVAALGEGAVTSLTYKIEPNTKVSPAKPQSRRISEEALFGPSTK